MSKPLIRHPAVLAIAALVATPTIWAALQAQNPVTSAGSAPAAVDFARDIQPILQTTCVECHGPKKTKAQLRLDSAAGVLKGGRPCQGK